MVNQVVLHMIKDLKQASKKNEAPIWSKIADLALKPSSSKRTVNLTRINKITKEGDVLFVPGKVLGTGSLSHKITLSSFSIFRTAVTRIIESGGNIMTHFDKIKKFPLGKGVIIFD